MTSAANLRTANGEYRLEFVRGDHAVAVGTIRARDGALTGSDVRGISYAGSYRQDASGAISVDLTLTIPASTALVSDVVSHPKATTVNVTFQAPANALLSGQAITVPVDLSAAHGGDVSFPEVTFRLQRT